jgi:lactate racemase
LPNTYTKCERKLIMIIPFGDIKLEIPIPDNQVDIITPNEILPISDTEDAVIDSLMHPIDLIDDAVYSNGKKAAIAVNDATRPVPNKILLPPLLKFLKEKGIKKEAVSFYIATGTHKGLGEKELHQILPSLIIDDYPIIQHDCEDKDNLQYIGETSRRTPIYVNRRFYNEDIKIMVGNIEPHHFMGYSGGAKSAAIGLTSRETIRINHSHLMEPDSFIGNYDTNPTRMDLEEIGDKIQITAALNAILNSEKQIVRVLWGSPRGVMRVGVPISRQVCQKKVDKKYDLIIASPGGYPKDINLYQSQKAITHVSQIAKENGAILLIAECRQGLGNEEFEKYLSKFTSLQDVNEQFRKEKFEIGPHKAFQLAFQAAQNRLILYTSMQPSLMQKTHLEFATTITDALKLAFAGISNSCSIAVVPYATNTMLY